MWVLLIPLIALVLGLAVIWLEHRHYDRHPEKERPDPDPWP